MAFPSRSNAMSVLLSASIWTRLLAATAPMLFQRRSSSFNVRFDFNALASKFVPEWDRQLLLE